MRKSEKGHVSRRQAAQNAQNAEHMALAWERRKAGWTYEQISSDLGISTAHAWKLVNDHWTALNDSVKESAESVREIELQKLDALEMSLGSLAHEQDLIIMVPTEFGEMPGTREKRAEVALKTADRLVKIAERRARLLGLDAPEKQEHVHTFQDLRESGIDPAAVSPLLIGIAKGTGKGGATE